MFKNYLKIAWRNLTNNKIYSWINIGGLAIGIVACLLILQYVVFELSYEDFHAKKERIYRVRQDRYDNGKLATQWAAGAYAVGNSFKEAIPEIEEYVKVVETSDILVEVDNRPLKIEKVFFATNSFFDVFSYPLIYGDVTSVLSAPNTAALSETTALKIFGTKDIVGKNLRISGDRTYKITGVYQDMPVNTQLRPNFLASYKTFVSMNTNNDGSTPEEAWTWDGCLTYLLLQKGVNPAQVEAKFAPIVEEGVGELLRSFNASVKYSLQPLTNIHLDSNYMDEPVPNGDGKTIYLLLGIAFFIILIAWVNYINLSTARAIGRAKEVGIRKSVGSQRGQLVVQFFFESVVFNGLALVLALMLMIVALPFFNEISGQPVSYTLFEQGRFWLGLIALFVVGVVLSGLYPAIVLSRFRPVEVLKGKMVSTTEGAFLRKGLVILQFTASLFLLIGSFVVYQQIQFMRDQSLGINISQTLVLPPPIVSDSTFVQKKEAFKETLLQYSLIEDVAVSSFVPGMGPGDNAGGIRLLSQDDTEQKQYRFIRVDYDFADVFEINIIAGRKFSKDFGTERTNVIFNRKGIEQLGFDNPEQAIGEQIEFWGDQCEIVGVVENFHQESLRDAYEPLILILNPDVYGYFSIKIETSQIAQTIARAQTEWNDFFPGNTFEYFFLDERFNEQYKVDQRFGQVFGLFTLLAIFVACLGLFGLASFTALQRKKEIGIRKVLGASVPGILRLLYKEFAVLLIIAFLISIPLAWFSISKWLEGYAFRIAINWSFFLLPFIAILVIALVTVSFQTLKASLANPVKSLRTE
ncbi:ABC transporter permease [Maribacter cobaltidurans]|uniref:ABC transporter permease n=1 Tax=Maribacter cobaltidurans TaxID=1178778 RepID=A0A223V6C2_9FLAO|nr:ABC transporter permease [Maribacter cobaltidurans]ASV30548.1 ABC transporter permease [Maribacter cobaltidurans]GGD79628.1 ABC transporter permease [Maribacter cobaltidurans]